MAPAPARGRSPSAVAVTGLAALPVAMGIGRFAFTPILPMMQEDAGLSVARSGWPAAANYWVPRRGLGHGGTVAPATTAA
jgi:hypothetical protein